MTNQEIKKRVSDFLKVHDDVTEHLVFSPNNQTVLMLVDGKGNEKCPNIVELVDNLIEDIYANEYTE